MSNFKQCVKTEDCSGNEQCVTLNPNKKPPKFYKKAVDDGDGEQISNTLNIVDQLKKKTTITAENVQNLEKPEEQTDVAKNLRAMLKTKTRSPFDEN